MALTIDDTVGGANANSYASLAYYKTYLESRPLQSQSPWFAAAIAGSTIDEQLKADLITATRLLTRSLDWTGTAAAATQALIAPRIGWKDINGNSIPSNIVPSELKDAICEYGIHLHNTKLLDINNASRLGVSRIKAGSVEIGFHSPGTDADAMNAQILALDPKFDYTRVPESVRRLLVPSWYRTSSIKRRRARFNVYG